VQIIPGLSTFLDIEFMVAILKLDPSPALAGEIVTVVYRVSNFTSSTIHVKVAGHTDEGTSLRTNETDIPPQDSVVGTLGMYWFTMGSHLVTIEARRRTSQVIVVPGIGPSPVLTTAYAYSDPVIDESPIEIYADTTRPPSPTVTNAGPSEPPGSTNGGLCAAGVVADIGGSRGLLYVVSKTGGVWASPNEGPWHPSPGSPPWGNRIAVDPGDAGAISVGGRAGDALDPRLDVAGLWESSDAGAAWAYSYDPFPDTGGQQIYDLAYARTRTLFLATAAGVGRRPVSSGTTPALVEYPPSAQGGPVRAVAVTETKVWARTTTDLLFSSDDGQNWTRKALPTAVDLPGFPGSVPLYDNTAGFGNGNDRASFAAFDDAAYLIMEIADASGNVVTSRSPLLIYDATSDTFKAQFTNDNDGRGLGGTRFVKSYVLDCLALPASIGQGRQVFFGAGQGIQQALSENADRTINFDQPVFTDYAGNPNPIRHIHSDLWAFHISPAYCPPDDTQVWVGCDGGVYRSTGNSAKLTDLKWITHDEELFTHNITQMEVIQADGSGPTLVAYGTQDNDAWWRKADGSWRGGAGLGDVGLTIADTGNRARVMFSRGFNANQSAISNLDNSVTGPFAVNPDAIQVIAIQTVASDTTAYDKLDLVMLTRLPVHDPAGQALPLDLFTPGDTTNTFLLLRNISYADNPDGPASNFAGWASVGPRLPGSPQRVWVAGGHATPVYYLAAADANGTVSLYKRIRQSSSNNLTWQPILTQLLFAGGAAYGPVFVNPYDPNLIFAAAVDNNHPNGAIFVSRDGGSSFQADEVLTALLTNSGRYRLGIFSASSQAAEVGSTFHGGLMFNPSHISFSPSNPSFVAACSPVTGVFFANMARGCVGSSRPTRDRNWRTLTPYLPDPFSYISAAGFDGGQLYFATQGRGLLHLDDPFIAPPASYFDPLPDETTSLAVLRDNVAAPVPWARASVLITRIDPATSAGIPIETRTVVINRIVRTDANGIVTVPEPLTSGTYIAQLAFPGDGQLAPYQTRFIYTGGGGGQPPPTP
jgi:hypothetical protein